MSGVGTTPRGVGDPVSMTSVEFDRVSKVFPDGTVAVSELCLQIREGEFMVFVGPSGCGKTTALRMVAGLEDVTSGEIRIGGRVVNDVPPRERDVAMVFQSYSLYPHLSVYDNMAFGLRLRRKRKTEVDARVRGAAQMLDLDPYLSRKPRELSGGQRQRVAMGRAIVREPRAYLMDEPLSNLDAKLRVHMRAEIGKIQRELGVTTIFVTHDQVEAMTMGTRVAVMRKGEVQQVGPPEEVYNRPNNLFVAGFIGSPAMNFLEAQIDGAVAKLAGHDIPVPPRWADERSTVIVGFRPEAVCDASTTGGGSDVRVPGHVELVESLGPEVIVHVAVDAKPVLTDEVREIARDTGEEITRAERATVVARFDAGSRARTGERIELAIDPERLMFFDPETGTALAA
jgi:multiple sugar transport system ATP-binding protein